MKTTDNESYINLYNLYNYFIFSLLPGKNIKISDIKNSERFPEPFDGGLKGSIQINTINFNVSCRPNLMAKGIGGGLVSGGDPDKNRDFRWYYLSSNDQIDTVKVEKDGDLSVVVFQTNKFLQQWTAEQIEFEVFYEYKLYPTSDGSALTLERFFPILTYSRATDGITNIPDWDFARESQDPCKALCDGSIAQGPNRVIIQGGEGVKNIDSPPNTIPFGIGSSPFNVTDLTDELRAVKISINDFP